MSKKKAVWNTFVVFLASGFWHGPNWTFIVWGLINAVLFIPLLLTGMNRKHVGIVAEKSALPSISEIFQMSVTFLLVTLTWIFFRSSTVEMAFDYISFIVTKPFFPHNFDFIKPFYFPILTFFIAIEWLSRKDGVDGFIAYRFQLKPIRYLVYSILLLIIVYFGAFNNAEFIYFQF